MKTFRNLLALIATLTAMSAASAAERSIVLASTTSVEASGLLAHILPQFTAKTGIEVDLVRLAAGNRRRRAARGLRTAVEIAGERGDVLQGRPGGHAGREHQRRAVDAAVLDIADDLVFRDGADLVSTDCHVPLLAGH